MPSRQLPSPPLAAPPAASQNDPRFAHPLGVSAVAAFSLLIVFSFCFGKISRKRTVPASDSDSKPPHRFSYSNLRRATSGFSPSLRLGQGGFGSVYQGTLKPGIQVAVKLMDSGSLQGEREFQNELFLAGKIESNHIVSLVGFSSDPRRRRMLLVYELMPNGSLQDCLLHRKCVELKEWKNRFSIALDIAKGLEYLHHFCDPPIIHGDIKPSNILLDANFSAKLGDFGLARLKSEVCQVEIEGKKDGNLGNGTTPVAVAVGDSGSVVEETESVITVSAFEGFDGGVELEQSPESVYVTVEASPEMVEPGVEGESSMVVSPRTVAAMAAPMEGFDRACVSEGNFDRASVESDNKNGKLKKKKGKSSVSGKDWWWKQDMVDTENGVVKDYVRDWIGKEIKKERPKSEWIGASSNSGAICKAEKEKKKKNGRRLDWWVSLDDDRNVKKEKRRPAREWWKEEYCEELARKKKKKKKQELGSVSDDCYSENGWPRDDDIMYSDKKKGRSRSRKSSKSSMDRWLDGFSGDLWRARKNSFDSVSGDIPKSGGVSSTPSMRGTVCYIAPEYGTNGDLSEKCDVYSFGVLLLVLIAGRRPLEVTSSPMSEFQRANLLSWTRHLARAGKLVDLVDQSVHSVDKQQALLCITVALLCLQKSPARRPSMKEVVGILSGDLGSPKLPVEFSPSPPSRFPYKSHKRVR